MIFTGETTVRVNCVKGMVWNLPGKNKIVRTVKRPVKVNAWCCFSSKGFGRIVCFKENLNAELMCDIYKRGLLPTAQKQFGHDSMLCKLQEDNDPKHRSKLAVNWKRNNGVDEIYWSVNVTWSCTHRKRMATTQDEFKKEKYRKLSIFGLGDKAGMEVLTIGISCKACIQYEQSNF